MSLAALNRPPHAALAEAEDDESIVQLLETARVVERGSATAEEVDRLFREEADLEAVAIVDQEDATSAGRPTHLIPRDHFYVKTGGPFGFALFQKRSAELVGKPEPLVVHESATARWLARLALQRPREDQYDPVIVERESAGLALLTFRRLLERVTSLEIRTAQLLDPLTQLPGPRRLHEWLEAALAGSGELTVVFGDLCGFREFNEAFGLVAGDALVKLAAEVMAVLRERVGPAARLGHAGGDKFVLVSPISVSDEHLREVAARFDREKLPLFLAEDRLRGTFSAVDDRGNRALVPLTTLILSAIERRQLSGLVHPAMFAQSAVSQRPLGKALTEALGRSGFVRSVPLGASAGVFG